MLVHPDDVCKCGFTTPFGNFEFTRMVMGMKTAPSTFQRFMGTDLSGIDGAQTYVDDTFAFTKDLAAS